MIETVRAHNSALYRAIKELKNCIESSNVFAPKDVPQVFFICGANRICAKTGANLPSFRREEFIRFLDQKFINVHAFLAENVFNKLLEKEKKKNILKLEQELFNLSDNIVIILESNSTFCELGAFSHQSELRKKMVVVNDAKFIKSNSFINHGPLDLIKSENKEKAVFWYKMGNVEKGVDSIGDIYEELEALIDSRRRQRSLRVSISIEEMTKNQLLFIRDLINLCGTISGKELFEILKFMFGNRDYSHIHTVIALLETMKLIHVKDGNYYPSSNELFFEYRHLHITKFKSSFRVYSLRQGRL